MWRVHPIHALAVDPCTALLCGICICIFCVHRPAPPSLMPLPPLAASPRPAQGNRETARAVLQDKGVSILTDAQVTELRRAGAPSSSSGSNSGSEEASFGSGYSSGSGSGGGEDLAKRLVYLRDREGQQEVRKRSEGRSGQVPRMQAWWCG